MRQRSRHPCSARALGLLALSVVSVGSAACTAVIGDPSAGPTGVATGGGSTQGGPPIAAGSSGTGGLVSPASCDDARARVVPKLLRLSNHEYRNLAADVLGAPIGDELFAAWPPVAEVYGFDTMSETRIDSRGLGEQLSTAETLAELALTSPKLSAGCPAPITAAAPEASTALTWDNCGAPLVLSLGNRAFRRPLRAEELAGYQQLFATSQQAASSAVHPFYEALTTVVQALLLSPNVMFKAELVPGGLEPSERSYGVASKLALFFRSSVADDELWKLAAADQLADAAVIEQQAGRLLAADSERFVRSFGGQWLDFRDDASEGDALIVSMQRETAAVFEHVLVAELPAQRLLAPGVTFVDQPLAAHYGLTFEADGPSLQKVDTQARGGLLSQGAFLKRTANGSEFRRPIHRGLWTMTRLLCRELPRLDAATVEEISESFENIDRSRPLSEQMEVHRSGSPRCLGCHGEIDPIGLALEKYDKQGLWREVDDNGHAITSDLQLFGAPVADPMQLAAAIEGSEEFRACVADKLLTYALNRGPVPEEACVSQRLAAPASGAQPSLKAIAVGALLASLKLTDPSP